MHRIPRMGCQQPRILVATLAIAFLILACERQPLATGLQNSPTPSVSTQSDRPQPVANDNPRFTWPDALKLCVPFFFSLCAMWGAYQFNLFAEMKAKQRLLVQFQSESRGYVSVIEAFDTVKSAIKENKIRMFSFDIPSALTRVAERLAELDPARGLIYVQYASNAELVRSGTRTYLDLLKSVITAKEDCVLCRAALFRQIRALKGDLINFARSELELMEILAGVARQELGYNPNSVADLRQQIAKAEELFAADDGT